MTVLSGCYQSQKDGIVSWSEYWDNTYVFLVQNHNHQDGKIMLTSEGCNILIKALERLYDSQIESLRNWQNEEYDFTGIGPIFIEHLDNDNIYLNTDPEFVNLAVYNTRYTLSPAVMLLLVIIFILVLMSYNPSVLPIALG